MYSYNEVFFQLGILSTKHIERGQEIINNISEVINESNTNDFIFLVLSISWLFINIFFLRSIVKNLK